MNTLVLRLPAHTTANSDFSRLDCGYILRGKQDVIERQGHASLADIAALIRNAQSVTVLIAAADVTVLNMVVPPLSGAKLRAALPNLIEDKLLAEVAHSAVACSANQHRDRTRSIAVMQRAYLENVAMQLHQLGAQRLRILPEQTCLPIDADGITALVSASQNSVTLTVRRNQTEAIGLQLATPEDVPRTLRTLVPDADICLYVSSGEKMHYQKLFAEDARVTVFADDAMPWQIDNNAPNLMSALNFDAQSNRNWQPWRWSLLLAGMVLLINIVALNFDWWRLNREANNVRSSMKQIYQSAYPNENVILDPLLQMRQKLAHAQTSADDFANLLAIFAQAWTANAPATSISGIDFHEHSLMIHLKSDVPAAAMQTALAAHGLTLEASNQTWQIRGQK